MKTIIVIENGKVTVQVDDQKPIAVDTSPVKSIPAETPRATVATPPEIKKAKEAAERVEEAPKSNFEVFTPPPKQCLYCKDDISGLDKRRKICPKSLCKRAYAAEQNRKSAERRTGITPKPRVKATTLPNAIKKDAEPLEIKDEHGVFLDPWDCQMCRNKGDQCDFHTRMGLAGLRPKPKGQGV